MKNLGWLGVQPQRSGVPGLIGVPLCGSRRLCRGRTAAGMEMSRAAERGPASPSSRPSGPAMRDGDESPHAKSLSSTRDLSLSRRGLAVAAAHSVVPFLGPRATVGAAIAARTAGRAWCSFPGRWQMDHRGQKAGRQPQRKESRHRSARRFNDLGDGSVQHKRYEGPSRPKPELK